MKYVEISLDGVGATWSSEVQVLDVSVNVGQNEKSNSTEISLADPDNAIAAKLVNHSLRNGGIVPLEQPEVSQNAAQGSPTATSTTSPTPTNSDGWEKLIVQGCIKYGVTDHNQIAYILATAQAETSMGASLVELSSGAQYQGRTDLGNTQPGDGIKYKGRGLVQVTGKANYAKMSKVVGVDLVTKPDLLTQPDIAVKTLVIGMQRGSFTGRKLNDYINSTNVDFYNARRIVNGTDKAQEIANSAKNVYLPKVASLLQQSGTATSAIAAKPKVAPEPTTNVDAITPEAPIKGSQLFVSIGDTTFTFYHQGTETSNSGITKVTGQGIRWVLNRRKRNKTEKGIKLSELVAKVAKAHKLKAVYTADVDPTYVHLNQSNITDYQLLKRECDRAGLFISEANGTLTVKSLRNLSDSSLVLTLGVNLISYSFKDAAIDTYADDTGSALLQGDPKVELNAVTGQFEQKRVDVDIVQDTSSSGKDKTDTSGIVQPGAEPAINASKARTKRVKGLPSSFTIPLTDETLKIVPLTVIRTKGLPETFNRVWLVDNVKHQVAAGTTTLDCYSPVEVITTMDSQPVEPSAASADTTVAASNPGGYIYGAKGTVTSPYGMRIHPVSGKRKMHHGVDISGGGLNVVAAKDGVVTFRGNYGGGGQTIKIAHGDGYVTVYMHLASYKVSVGQKVTQGQSIAVMGTTGASTGVHLHFQIDKVSGGSVPHTTVGLKALVKGSVI